jgi:surface polysaccharide O-acyltransferase-like enzyme
VPQRQLAGADLLRCVAVLMVIAIHTSTWQGKQDVFKAFLFPSLAAVARFSVPAFVLLSGLLIAYRTTPTNRAWLSRRLRRSLFPYVVWVPAFILFGIFVSHAIPQHFSNIIGWVGGGSDHLYYLLLAAQLCVIGMIRLPSGNRLVLAAAAAVTIQVGLGVWRLYLPLPGGWLSDLIDVHSFQIIISWLGYAGIGAVLGERMRRGRPLPSARVLLTCTIALGIVYLLFGVAGSPHAELAIGTGAYLVPLLLPFTTCFCMLLLVSGQAMSRVSRPARFVKATSRHSLGIYLVHPAFIYLTGSLLYGLLGSSNDALAVAAFLLMYSAAFVGGFVVTRLLAASRLAMLVGESRQPLTREGKLACASRVETQPAQSPAA